MSLLNLIRAGRMTRLQYAACTVAFLAMLMLATKLFPMRLVGLAMPPIWMLMVAAPRLREIGWSPWWALGLLGPNFLAGFIGGLASLPADSPPRAALNSIAGLATFGFFVLLGAMRSALARGGGNVGSASRR